MPETENPPILPVAPETAIDPATVAPVPVETHVPIAEVIGTAAELVGDVGKVVEAVAAAPTIAGAVQTVADAAPEVLDTAQQLAVELVELEEWLVAQGTSVVQMLRTVATNFHGIRFL